MNEPKRRGRPPKAKLLQPSEPRIEGADCVECGQAVGHYDDCSVGITGAPVMATFPSGPIGSARPVHLASTPLEIKREAESYVLASMREQAQAYAIRVWSGQSVNIPRNERLKRVKAALDGQNLSMEGVVLP
jgi:hypothetical protein